MKTQTVGTFRAKRHSKTMTLALPETMDKASSSYVVKKKRKHFYQFGKKTDK
jgi:hypothetical protein